jgi:hypothetical protein
MTRGQRILVAGTLKYMGFSTKMTDDNSILVALNRGISTSEVREALERVFDEIQFNVEYWYGKVKVS